LADKQEKKKRGFALLSPEQRREIGRKGGASVSALNRAFSRNNSLAVISGQKGGAAVPPEKRFFAVDRNAAARAGSKARRNQGYSTSRKEAN
jgi:general stress protein YciG